MKLCSFKICLYFEILLLVGASVFRNQSNGILYTISYHIITKVDLIIMRLPFIYLLLSKIMQSHKVVHHR